jgi:hypothetical protein
VVGVFDRLTQADAAAERLRADGAALEDISVAYRPGGASPQPCPSRA